MLVLDAERTSMNGKGEKKLFEQIAYPVSFAFYVVSFLGNVLS